MKLMRSWCNIGSRQMGTEDVDCWHVSSTLGWSAVCSHLMPKRSVNSLRGSTLMTLQPGELQAYALKASAVLYAACLVSVVALCR